MLAQVLQVPVAAQELHGQAVHQAAWGVGQCRTVQFCHAKHSNCRWTVAVHTWLDGRQSNSHQCRKSSPEQVHTAVAEAVVIQH